MTRRADVGVKDGESSDELRTNPQRTFNKEHSRVRIRVENGIRRVKVFRSMKERCRNKLRKYDHINDIVCGVVNQTILMKRAGTL